MPATKLGLILACRRKTKRRHLSPLPSKDPVFLWAQGWTPSWSSSNAVACQGPEETRLSCCTSPQQVALASEKLRGWGHCQDGSMKPISTGTGSERGPSFINSQQQPWPEQCLLLLSHSLRAKTLWASSLWFQQDFCGTAWKEVEKHRNNFRYHRDHITQSESGKCIPKKDFSVRAGATFKNLNSVPAPDQEPKSDCRWIYPANAS